MVGQAADAPIAFRVLQYDAGGLPNVQDSGGRALMPLDWLVQQDEVSSQTLPSYDAFYGQTGQWLKLSKTFAKLSGAGVAEQDL